MIQYKEHGNTGITISTLYVQYHQCDTTTLQFSSTFYLLVSKYIYKCDLRLVCVHTRTHPWEGGSQAFLFLNLEEEIEAQMLNDFPKDTTKQWHCWK